MDDNVRMVSAASVFPSPLLFNQLGIEISLHNDAESLTTDSREDRRDQPVRPIGIAQAVDYRKLMGHQTTILLVGYDSEKWLDKCLSSLASASHQKLQLCFVDNKNNPTLKTLDLSPFSVEILKTPKPLGFADANNFGIQQTHFKSDYTVFLNQDTVSTDGWIDRCVKCFEDDSQLGILSPGLRTYDLSEWEPNLLACVKESGTSIELQNESAIELHNVTAAAMVIRTEVLHKVGPFDPIFGSYYEDYDLCRRVRNAGCKVAVCPAAQVGHFSGSVTSTPAAEKRRTRAIARNRLIHHVREHSGDRLSVLAKHLFYALPLNLIRGLLRTSSSQPISATLGAQWDLVKIAGRLVSERRDHEQWKHFLSEFRAHTASLAGVPGK